MSMPPSVINTPLYAKNGVIRLSEHFELSQWLARIGTLTQPLKFPVMTAMTVNPPPGEVWFYFTTIGGKTAGIVHFPSGATVQVVIDP